MDLSKREVIAAQGIPTRANPLSHRAIGGPGFEIWDYYQLSETGEVEVMNVIFENSMQNLGKDVGYSVGIDRSRIIDSDTPDGMSRILEYDRKNQPFE